MHKRFTKINIAAILFTFIFLFTGCPSPSGGEEDLTTPTDLTKAFDNILTSKEWKITNKTAFKFENGIYTIDCREPTGSLKRNIVLESPKILCFRIKTHLYETYDGHLSFKIDNEEVKQYTGPNGEWENQKFELQAGAHTIEWLRVDPAPNTKTNFASNNEPEAFISLKDFVFLDFETETNLETVFDNILDDYYWIITNKSAITEENGIIKFDGKKNYGGFKRIIILNDTKALTFNIKTNIYEEYDGCFQFLIDDEIKGSYTGLSGDWENCIFEIEPGTHTIEWKKIDKNGSWTNYDNLCIEIKDFSFKEPVQALTTINQNFDSTLDSDMWICSGIYAQIVQEEGKWSQSGDALIDTHRKVLQLATYIEKDNNQRGGDSSLLIYKIKVTEESALSFDYKCDLAKGTYDGKEYKPTFKVFVDDATEAVFEESGYGQLWKNASVVLSPGIHSIKFSAITDSWYHFDGISNSVFIDNITLAPNKIDSVDIYPKGLQETYIGGFPIQFSAKALRSDGSVLNGKNINWTATGGTIDNNGKFTPGAAEGIFTVTATIDGIAASNQNIKIHGVDYTADPITINGHTFTGKITVPQDIAPQNINTNKITFETPTPQYFNFTADGFFVLKGYADNTYVDIFIRKKGDDALINNQYNPDYPYQTYYVFAPGNFEERIWLRYGDGDYDIYITERQINYNDDYDGYEGAMMSYAPYTWEAGIQTFLTVTNKTDLDWTPEDCAYLLPSYVCQSDNFIVSNAYYAVMAELPENASIGQKLQALYDWVININHYDFVSLEDGKRKKQDAAHVVQYGMSVCEGYANLYTALARLAGVKSAYQTSAQLNHGWTECYYKGQWKMVDATWDDPSDETVTESIPNAGNYSYFLIDPKDSSHAGEDGSFDNKTDFSRSIVSQKNTNELEYYPNCTF